MANHKSSIKRIRQTEKRRLRNRFYARAMRAAVRGFRALTEKAEAEAKLKRAEDLAIGAEIGHGTLERTVEITIGTNIDALMGAEIVTEDGKVIAFRE